MRSQDHHLLRNIPLFQSLDDKQLSDLTAEIEKVRFAHGRIIYNQGDDGGTMYIVVSGLVESFLHDNTDDRVILELIEPGGMFGELSLLDGSPRSAGAKALETTTLLVINREGLQRILITHPTIAFDILSLLGKRLRASNHIIRQRTTRNVNAEISDTMTFGERLSDFLTNLIGTIGFIYFCTVVVIAWILINTGSIPKLDPFDPFPFGLMAMMVSVMGIFLTAFVLISQNRQAAHEKIRNDIEYEVNVKAEEEIRQISKQIETMEQIMIYHLAMLNTQVLGEEKAEEIRRTSRSFHGAALRDL